MSELRQDPTTRNWVILAPERTRRPRDGAEGGASAEGAGPCPFCPGNEAMTPAELWRLPAPGGGWRVRVFPNRFPALTPGESPERKTRDGFLRMGGHGHHEVVVESPDHGWNIAEATVVEIRDVLHAWAERYRELRSARGAEVIVVFRNHGPESGTSLVHPHSQIVVAPVVPPYVRQRLEVARRYLDDHGTCLYLDIVERELADGSRVVAADGSVAAFQPFAAAAAYETWLMPQFHQASFGDAEDDVLADLAGLLRRVLAGLSRVLHDPPYNLVVHSAPPGEEGSRYFVWHVRIVPRLSTPAGFELGSGIQVNASLPEQTAPMLRDAAASVAEQAG